MFWSKQNPHFFEEVEHPPLHVLVKGAMNSEYLVGPYFFDGSVNHLNYLAMLENWFIQQQSLGIKSNVWFQEDGAPSNFAIIVREYLNEVFPSRWIGSGSATLPAPLDWPPRSSDLTTCGNCLWSFIKEKFAQQRYTNTDELKQAMTYALKEDTPQMPRTMSDRTWPHNNICCDNDGAQTDSIERKKREL